MFDKIRPTFKILQEGQCKRLQDAIKELELSKKDIANITKIINESLIIYKDHPNDWRTILKIRDNLPGNDEEKAIFMMGYMFNVFIGEIK